MSKYCYVIVNIKDKPIVISAELPLFWNRSVAQKEALRQGKCFIKRIIMEDLQKLINKSESINYQKLQTND